MKRTTDSPIVALVCRFVAPFIQLFALYVIFHGHASPGGGFQGGAMLGASLLLIRIALGSGRAQAQFPKAWGTPLGSVGVLIYAGTGLAALALGGSFLDYHFLPLPWLAEAARRWAGILMVEVGVGIAVMATMVSIYDDLEGEPDES